MWLAEVTSSIRRHWRTGASLQNASASAAVSGASGVTVNYVTANFFLNG